MSTLASFLSLGALLIAGALSFGLLVLFPWILLAGCTYISFLVGRGIDLVRKTNHFRFFIPLASLAAASLWGILSYHQFTSLCERAPTRVLIGRVAKPQSGFLLDDQSLRQLGANKEIKVHYKLLENGQIAYFDYYDARYNPQVSPEHISRERKEFSSKVAEPRSGYVFKVLPILRVNEGWLSPTYQVRYSIQSADAKEVFAQSSEYVFGGGILGFYIHAVLGERGDYDDKDYKYLSCGHASQTPMAWRPRFSTNPNAENYLHADRELVSAALL